MQVAGLVDNFPDVRRAEQEAVANDIINLGEDIDWQVADDGGLFFHDQIQDLIARELVYLSAVNRGLFWEKGHLEPWQDHGIVAELRNPFVDIDLRRRYEEHEGISRGRVLAGDDDEFWLDRASLMKTYGRAQDRATCYPFGEQLAKLIRRE